MLVLNKIDLVQKEKLLELSAKINVAGKFRETFMVSALTGRQIDEFTNIWPTICRSVRGIIQKIRFRTCR